jgi:hypothetical protein
MRLPQGVLEWAYAEPFIRQGPHPDPLSSPLPRLEPWIVTCLNGSVMPMYRQCLSLDLGPDEDIRQTVLSELSEYYGRSFEDSLNRCINWEDYSLEISFSSVSPGRTTCSGTPTCRAPGTAAQSAWPSSTG